MNILNISKLKLNDSHSYYGGAIGNIAYNQLASLARQPNLTVHTTAEGTEFESNVPEALDVTVVDDYDGVAAHFEDKREDTDVVTHFYFHEPESNPVSKAVADSECPFVIGMCEVPHPRFADEVSGIERLPLVRRVGKRLIMPRFKRTLRRADRLVVVDEHAKEFYGEYYPTDRIDVIPYGVDIERFQPSPIPDEPRILMVNRLIKRRGVDHMIKALPTIKRAVPDVSLHVVGDGPQRDDLTALTSDLDVGDAVTFHGNLPSEALVEQYAAATVFAHLSFADGWNQPALEAMASARPVVCTSKPHNSMVVDGKTGYKVPWEDPVAVADALTDLLADIDRAAAFGKTGRERVEANYTWSDIAERYRSLLADVAAPGDR
jgi:phosphatidylinositol alpha-1,6-mannosyltransferase